MVAHAKARESNADFRAFVDPADAAEIGDFRGSFSGYERSAFFVNDGAGRFVDCAHGFGLDDDEDGRAVAPIDVDGDGDLDLVRLSLTHARLLLNQAAPRHFLRVRLRATASEPSALGAVVKITAGGRSQIDRMRLTMGFHTQVLPELHFGLGDAQTADVEVRWPSGRIDRHVGLAADHVVHVEEGGAATSQAIPRWPAGSAPKGRAGALDVPAQALDGTTTRLAPRGKPVVVNFWAPWCTACTTEGPALAALHARLGETTRFVGVSIERADLAGVRAFAAQHGLTYPLRLATDALVRAFFGEGAQIALPATFVFDAQGALRRAFYRPVSAADIEGALATTQPAAVDHLVLFEEAIAAGREDAARRALADALAAAPDDPATITQAATGYLRLREVERARDLLESAVRAQPAASDLWAILASVRGNSGDVAGARAATQRALELAPKNPFALNVAGMDRMAAGDLPAARRYFERAIEAAPRFMAARMNLERVERALRGQAPR